MITRRRPCLAKAMTTCRLPWPTPTPSNRSRTSAPTCTRGARPPMGPRSARARPRTAPSGG
eukprot:11201062-Lingulodinium_polyedra.AAC.1